MTCVSIVFVYDNTRYAFSQMCGRKYFIDIKRQKKPSQFDA